MSSDSEQLVSTPEQNVELTHPIENRTEKLDRSPETTVELSPRDVEAKAERARIEALESAVSVESGGKEKDTTKNQTLSGRRGPIGKKQLNESFTRTVSQVQKELPIGSRLFSKLIHNKAVEATSDVIGSTVARPNAILAGAVSAFILTLLVYTVAKTMGYPLSGSESIVAFIIGWIIGVIFDYLRVLVTGKKFN